MARKKSASSSRAQPRQHALHISPSQRVELLLSQKIRYTDSQGRPRERYITQKELAAKLGVSDRTIRRWKRGDTQPALYRPEQRENLLKQSKKERDRRIRAGAPRVAVPPEAKRRELRLFKQGKWTGKTYTSPWRNFDMRRFSPQEIFEFLRALRDSDGRKTIQIIFQINNGPQKGTRGASEFVQLAGASDARLWALILEILERYKMDEESEIEQDEDFEIEGSEQLNNEILYVGVLENAAHERAA